MDYGSGEASASVGVSNMVSASPTQTQLIVALEITRTKQNSTYHRSTKQCAAGEMVHIVHNSF